MPGKLRPSSRLVLPILVLAVSCSRDPAPAPQAASSAPERPARRIDPRCAGLAREPSSDAVLLEGSEVSYPLQALAQGAEGRVSAGCTVTDEGRMADCRILKSEVPAIDGAVLDALRSRVYCPATKDAVPVAVSKTFSFRFKLADDAPARRSARK